MDPNCLAYGRRGSRSAAFDDALIIDDVVVVF
jgi:hypothetical protein